MSEKWIIFDACSLINCYASGFFDSILGNLKTQCCIVEQVNAESLFIRNPTELPQEYNYQPILLDSYIRSDRLKLVELETEFEKKSFIRLAQHLDDGEAATIALAIEREMIVVTDDKKAQRVIEKEASSIEVLTTFDIMKTWSESISMKTEEIKLALENIRIRANYQPGKNHHLFKWWRFHLSSGE